MDDDTLDVLEVRVGSGDLVDAEPSCDGKVDRVDGEQAVLFLQFQGDEEIIGANGLNREAAAEKVAHFVGIRGQLPNELPPLRQCASGIGANELAGLRLMHHPPVAYLGDDGRAYPSLNGAIVAAGKETAALNRLSAEHVDDDIGIHENPAAIENAIEVH